MIPLMIFAAAGTHRMIYLFPLIVVISLVVSASHYESPDRILKRAGQSVLWIVGVLGMILLVLAWLNYRL
jgi:hypothetical protein